MTRGRMTRGRMTRGRMTRGDGTACVCAWRLDDGGFARETALLPSTGGAGGPALLKRANMIKPAAALRKGRRKPRRSTVSGGARAQQLAVDVGLPRVLPVALALETGEHAQDATK